MCAEGRIKFAKDVHSLLNKLHRVRRKKLYSLRVPDPTSRAAYGL